MHHACFIRGRAEVMEFELPAHLDVWAWSGLHNATLETRNRPSFKVVFSP